MKEIRDFKKSFTLIELLLALSLFSLIALTVYNVFFSGMRLNARSESVNKIYREARWTLDQIAKELENFTTYDLSASYPDLDTFVGKDKEIQFILAAPTGLKVVRYTLQSPTVEKIHKTIIGKRTSKLSSFVVNKEEKEEKVNVFIREEMPLVDYLSANGVFEGPIEILSAQVKKDGLKFFFADRSVKDSNTIEWKTSWGQPYLPLGIRVELIFYNTGDKSYAEFHRDIINFKGLSFKTG